MALNLNSGGVPCSELAQGQGALVKVQDKCVPVAGREIKIEDTENSVMEGFEITNFNFHCSGSQPPMPGTPFLPGPIGDARKSDYV